MEGMMQKDHNAQRRGLSLLEVTIALVVLAFGILTMGTMQLHAMRQNSAGRHTTDAAAVARTYLEQVQRLPWTDLDAVEGAGWSAPAWPGVTDTVDVTMDTAGGGTAVENTYTAEWRVTDVPGNACLRDVELRVSWPEEGNAGPKNLVLATRRYDWGGAGC